MFIVLAVAAATRLVTFFLGILAICAKGGEEKKTTA